MLIPGDGGTASCFGVGTGRFTPIFLLDNGPEPPPRREGAESIFPAYNFSFPDEFHAAVESAKTRFRPPARQDIGATHDCKGLPSPKKSLAGSHTFANACDFRDGSPNPPLLIYVKQLPRCFRRIASWVKPYSSHLPLSGSSCRCQPCRPQRDSRVIRELLRNVAPLSPHSS